MNKCNFCAYSIPTGQMDAWICEYKEFDERALFDAKDSFYNRLVAYIDHFERQQAFRTSAMAYYSGNHAVLDMYKSTNPKDHEVMDLSLIHI